MTAPYGATVLEHFKRPRNQRALERPTIAREGYNPLCGDRIRIELNVDDGSIVAAAFTANACAICTASASVLTERLRDTAIVEAAKISDADQVDALGGNLPPARLACATLPLKALRNALAELTAE
jgi:nitrogen fixation protein NifU and related proteins